MNSHEVFVHIHQGCFAGTGAIVRLPQCQWSKPDGYGKISQCITTTKHSKAKTVCIFLGIYCIWSEAHWQKMNLCFYVSSINIWEKWPCIQIISYYANCQQSLTSTSSAPDLHGKESPAASPAMSPANKLCDTQNCVRNDPQHTIHIMLNTCLYHEASKSYIIRSVMADNCKYNPLRVGRCSGTSHCQMTVLGMACDHGGNIVNHAFV